MPDCWRVDYNRDKRPKFLWTLEAYLFQLLCLIAFGKTSLKSVWLDAQPGNEHDFRECKEQLKSQVNNTNIMVRSSDVY